MSIGRQGRVQVEDIVFLIRKDPRKFARVKDLLTMNEELKRARKAFDEANYGSWHRLWCPGFWYFLWKPYIVFVVCSNIVIARHAMTEAFDFRFVTWAFCCLSLSDHIWVAYWPWITPNLKYCKPCSSTRKGEVVLILQVDMCIPSCVHRCIKCNLNVLLILWMVGLVLYESQVFRRQ